MAGPVPLLPPPHAEVAVRARLPEPHDPAPDAERALLASLDLRARLDGRDVAFNHLPADAAGVLLTISNQVLRLRDLTVTRPEGRGPTQLRPRPPDPRFPLAIP
ncbi:MAG: hypothetical protein M5U12_06100 [Verrucomicrobia bacterium]|nr:hypothetical protein [Verrucomicrobiota bacterium]